jgi:hypothetical protein
MKNCHFMVLQMKKIMDVRSQEKETVGDFD